MEKEGKEMRGKVLYRLRARREKGGRRTEGRRAGYDDDIILLTSKRY